MDSEQLAPIPAEAELMRRIDDTLSHVWMVRTFLKHSDEASEDEELAEVHASSTIYARLGPIDRCWGRKKYLICHVKRLPSLNEPREHFAEIQPTFLVT